MSASLSDEINWQKFNKWIGPALKERNFHCIEEMRPVIRVGEQKICLLIAHRPQGMSGPLVESKLELKRELLEQVGVIKAAS